MVGSSRASPRLGAFAARCTRSRLAAAIFGLTLLASAAHAHDPYDSWATARLRVDRLEFIVTMAQSTALRLIDPELAIPFLAQENFEAHRPRLERAGANLCILTTARKPLVATTVAVELTEENDVVFKVIYPRPPAGRLHWHAAFLRKLGDGYGGTLEVNDVAGNNLGWEQVSFLNPNFEVTLPAAASPSGRLWHGHPARVVAWASRPCWRREAPSTGKMPGATSRHRHL